MWALDVQMWALDVRLDELRHGPSAQRTSCEGTRAHVAGRDVSARHNQHALLRIFADAAELLRQYFMKFVFRCERSRVLDAPILLLDAPSRGRAIGERLLLILRSRTLVSRSHRRTGLFRHTVLLHHVDYLRRTVPTPKKRAETQAGHTAADLTLDGGKRLDGGKPPRRGGRRANAERVLGQAERVLGQASQPLRGGSR
mmetsp:Transcript_30688/g.70738  ORF Transcript_30688/g.70738 Transcript_30688/m.70738 type:complete len:199 (+) Transcript_30688:57-653(+)